MQRQTRVIYNVSVFLPMLSVSCRDVGVDCDFKGTGETEEELMNNCVEHAIKDHGWTREDVMKPEMQEKIKALPFSDISVRIL